MVQVKRIVRIAPLLLFFGLTPAVLAAAENITKPNIVLVVMDNFGYGEPGVTGAELPTDRVIDGVDQSEFLLGRSKTSNRVSMVFYVRNELFGAKWRDWKMLLDEMDENYVVRKKTTASFYNLLMDPKEEEPALNVLDHTWVISPLGEVIERHLKSIAEDAGTPGP